MVLALKGSQGLYRRGDKKGEKKREREVEGARKREKERPWTAGAAPAACIDPVE